MKIIVREFSFSRVEIPYYQATLLLDVVDFILSGDDQLQYDACEIASLNSLKSELTYIVYGKPYLPNSRRRKPVRRDDANKDA